MKNNSMPKGILFNRKQFILKSKKILILSDLHSPYHNKTAIKKSIQIANKQKITSIILLGDIIDFYQISKYNKIPTAPNLQYELDVTYNLLSYIRKQFPKVQIIYMRGNHERRLQHYLCKNSELYNLNNMILEKLLRLDELNIKLLDDYTLIKYGNFTLLHGDEIKAGGSIDVCRNKLNYSKCSIVFGHHHTSDVYQIKTLDNNVLTSIAVGTLGELSPDYMPYNMNWNNGFCIMDEKGNYRNYKIVSGKVL